MASRLPDKIYFKIGEVSEIVGDQLGAIHDLDVELLLEIKRLLYADGFTIEGARKKLKENKKEEKEQLKLPLADQKYKNALAKIRKDLESLRKLLS